MDTSTMTLGDLLDIGQEMAAVPDGIMDQLSPEDCRQVFDVVNSFLLRIHGTAG